MHHYDAVLKNFLYKKFSRVCCLLFNYQDSFFFAVLFKRQLLYSIKALFVCQELFLFFCFASLITLMSFSATAYLDYHIQAALSTTFLFFQTLSTFRIIRIVSIIWNRNLFIPAVVPPPRLCMVLNRSLFSVVFSAVPQRLSYHIISVWNCQCFFYYLYNSENFCNSNYSDNYHMSVSSI